MSAAYGSATSLNYIQNYPANDNLILYTILNTAKYLTLANMKLSLNSSIHLNSDVHCHDLSYLTLSDRFSLVIIGQKLLHGEPLC